LPMLGTTIAPSWGVSSFSAQFARRLEALCRRPIAVLPRLLPVAHRRAGRRRGVVLVARRVPFGAPVEPARTVATATLSPAALDREVQRAVRVLRQLVRSGVMMNPPMVGPAALAARRMLARR
jgi:hypothetical protein